MDRPAIHAAEAFVHVGYPLDVEALLIVELDGAAGRNRPSDRQGRGDRPRAPRRDDPNQRRRCRAAGLLVGAQGGVPGGRPDLARLLLHGRHDPARPAGAGAEPACARLSEQYGLGVANVFHAGDGNLHPLILYDANKPGEIERAEAFGADILRLCVEVGGVSDRRARRRRRKARPDGDDVQRERPGPPAAGQMRVRSRRVAEPRQGVPAAASLRRTRPPSRPRRPSAVPRPAAVLSIAVIGSAVRTPRQPRSGKCGRRAIRFRCVSQ